MESSDPVASQEEGPPGPPPGPPPDAATTFEDLPGDLFGEEGYGSSPPEVPERATAPAGDAAPSEEEGSWRPASPRSAGGSARPGRRDTGSEPAAAHAEGSGPEPSPGDDVLDAVQRLFPGRIVSLEPLEEEASADEGAVPTSTLDAAPADLDGDE